MNQYKQPYMRMVELVILINGFLPRRNDQLQKEHGTRQLIRCLISELRQLRHA